MTNKLLIPVARKLRPLLGEIVFLGGSVVELLITDPAAPSVRPTKDVDFIVSVTTRLQYHKLGERLRELGFREDIAGGVICRWTDGEHLIDAMPTREEVLHFSNPWYELAFATAAWISLPELKIRVVRAPEFVATKLSAYKSRGNNDVRYSHDLEDVLLVIDGREELLGEIQDSHHLLKAFLQEEFNNLLQNRDFVEVIDAFGDRSRVSLLLQRIVAIAH